LSRWQPHSSTGGERLSILNLRRVLIWFRRLSVEKVGLATFGRAWTVLGVRDTSWLAHFCGLDRETCTLPESAAITVCAQSPL